MLNAISARAIADKKNTEVANAVHQEMLAYVDEQLTPAISAEAEKGNYQLTIKFPAGEVRFVPSAVRKELEARGFTIEYIPNQKSFFIVW